MRALSVVDMLFLLLESQKQPMHVAGLCIFEVPAHAGTDFVSNLITQIQNSGNKPAFPFDQKLYRRIFWQTDDGFDIQQHFRRVSLPAPHGTQELFDYISREHGRKLDRKKPLWELHFIDKLTPASPEGLPRFAIWLKVHHAMTDGVAAMRLLQRSLSTHANWCTSVPFWSIFSKHRHTIDELLPHDKPIFQILKEQCQSVVPVAYELFGDLACQAHISTFDTPKSILNQRISSTRHLSAHSFDKARFAHIAKTNHATTNDVILAVCAEALRAYLLEQNALPSKPLTAFVPISLRRDGSAVGNQLSFILTNLGTHLADPLARLQTIKDSISTGKRRFARLSPTQVINYSAISYAWAGLNLATRALPQKQAFNLIISNVPSSSKTLYLNGAKLTGIYPASVLFDGQALNITFVNHQDKIDFGITACRSALPHIEKLGKFITQALDTYEHLLTNNPTNPNQ